MKQGEVYYLDSAEPLHAGPLKNRRVVVVTNARDFLLDSPILVVACTGTIRKEQKATAVALPWHADGQASTGFRKPTWAIPEWLFRVRPSQLGACKGNIPKDKLQLIVERLPPDPLFDRVGEKDYEDSD